MAKRIDGKKLAEAAALAMVEANPSPAHVTSYAWLLNAGGFPERPTRGTAGEFQAWALAELEFRARLVELLLEHTGRFLDGTPKRGYMLLSHEASAPRIETNAYDRTQSTFDRARKLVKSVGGDSAEARKAKIDAEVRLGVMSSTAGRLRDEVTVEKRSETARVEAEAHEQSPLAPRRPVVTPAKP